MESNLCVLKGLVGMLDIGIYGSLLVNNFRNLKTGINGYEINAHLKKKSDNECLSGHWKGVNFDIFVVKNKKYYIIMMSTNSGLMVCEGKKNE